MYRRDGVIVRHNNLLRNCTRYLVNLIVGQYARERQTDFHEGIVRGQGCELGDLASRSFASLVNAVVLENIVQSTFQSRYGQVLLNVEVIDVVKSIDLMTPRIDIDCFLGESIVQLDEPCLNFLHSDAQHGGEDADAPVYSSRRVALHIKLYGTLSQVVDDWLFGLGVADQHAPVHHIDGDVGDCIVGILDYQVGRF